MGILNRVGSNGYILNYTVILLPLGPPTSSTPQITLGSIPNPAALANINTFSMPASRPATMTATTTVTPSRMSLQVPLSALTTSPTKADTGHAISIGPHSPPIPKKLAEKVWRNEFIELHELLPARLGVPQPTLMDVLAPSTPKVPLKQITSIEEWVMCFNTFIALVTTKQPERAMDLLAYSSIIVNASKQFEGTPWLEYDTRFRKQAAVNPSAQWASIDASSWTLCFSTAKPKSELGRRTQDKRFHPYKQANEVCRNFNNHRCFRNDCRFRHVCACCERPNHTDDQCPERKQAQPGTFRPQRKLF